jgi:hypothetical protein
VLSLSRSVYLFYDYYILRLHYLAVVLPQLNGELTGRTCSEQSVYRVSEIGMFALFLICFIYPFLMYYVFVVKLKPTLDDALEGA